MQSIVERFYRYTKYDTQSSWGADCVPTSSSQTQLAALLVQELQEMGIHNARMDDKSYVFAYLPSNTTKGVPSIAFFAHLDTSPDASGKDVCPKLIEKWDGTDILLNEQQNIHLSTDAFPDMKASIGCDLIVTDGTTLLGADDKAGIAEIMEAVRYITSHPEIEHGEVHLCFTPDEEVGLSTEHIDLSNIPAKYGYTVDGSELGEVNFENFNAATVTVCINGKDTHPGEAKHRMKNATLLASEYISMLPSLEIPSATDGYEGYYHVMEMSGNVSNATLSISLRDFTDEGYAYKKKRVALIGDTLNDYYGEGTFEVTVSDYYFNMEKEIEKYPEVKTNLLMAMDMAGVTPLVRPIRGGTDGSSISYMGMPCPNIFTGGSNFHSIYEYCNVQAMEKAVAVIVNLIEIFATR